MLPHRQLVFHVRNNIFGLTITALKKMREPFGATIQSLYGIHKTTVWVWNSGETGPADLANEVLLVKTQELSLLLP